MNNDSSYRLLVIKYDSKHSLIYFSLIWDFNSCQKYCNSFSFYLHRETSSSFTNTLDINAHYDDNVRKET